MMTGKKGNQYNMNQMQPILSMLMVMRRERRMNK